jgi:hypothetical protein
MLTGRPERLPGGAGSGAGGFRDERVVLLWV